MLNFNAEGTLYTSNVSGSELNATGASEAETGEEAMQQQH